MADLESNQRQKWIAGGSLGAAVVLALALFAMVNYLALRHYARFDWTSSKIYSLSEKTENVLEGLDREIDLVIFLSPGSEIYGAVDELLSRYQAANPALIHKRSVDPARNLLEARQLVEKYGIERENVVVVASGEDRRVIDEFDLADYDYSGAQFGQGPTLEAFKGEQQITSAILELVEDKKPKILVTTGHGEAGFAGGTGRSFSAARKLLGEDNFEIDEWASLGKTAVPAGTDLVIVAGPQSAFLAPELDVLSRYLDGGGRILLLLDPDLDPQSLSPDYGFGPWLERHGVEVRSDLVIDPSSTLPFFGAETLYTDAYGIHPIVESLGQTRTPVLLPLARSVSPAKEIPEGYKVDELVKTTSAGWADDDLAELPQIRQDDDDLAGPISLAVAVSFKVTPPSPEPEIAELADTGEETAEESTEEAAEDGGEEDAPEVPEARLVIFGDFDFAADDQIANGANAALLLNSLNWLVEREQLLAIEARRPEQTRLLLSGSEAQQLYLLVFLIMPAVAAAVGISIYLRRRR